MTGQSKPPPEVTSKQLREIARLTMQGRMIRGLQTFFIGLAIYHAVWGSAS